MKTNISILLCFCFSLTVRAQIITTVVGNGTAGFGGDGSLATLAEINGPYNSVIDSSGNIYVSDYYNNRIRKVSPSGIITTIAGTGLAGFSGDGGPATAATFINPGGIIVDAHGNVIFTDFRNYCIRKITPAGIISTIAGTPGVYGYSGDGGPATAAKFYYAGGLAIDRIGNIYVAEQWNNRLRKIDTFGIITTIAGNGPIGYGMGGYGGDGGPATSAQLNFASSVTLDTAGNIYFGDEKNHRIRKINTLGIITTFAGTGSPGFSGDGVAATATEINYPEGVAADRFGNVYIGDASNNRIRKVNSSGIISTIAGNGIAGYVCDGCAATLGGLNYPCDLFVDDAGNVYIPDHLNNRIRKVSNTTTTPPAFIFGSYRTIIVCENYPAVPINSLLSVSGVSAGITETWGVLSGPAHGIAVTSYSGVSSGDTLTPTGLNYTPSPGFTGTDTFSVVVSAGTGTDTIAIYVTINPSPFVGAITGTPYVCMGTDTTYLADTSLGGVWTTGNSAVALVTGAGAVYGVFPGTDTISYTVTNSDFECSTTAMLPVNVEVCEGVKHINYNPVISILPNPTTSDLSITSAGKVNVKLYNSIGQLVFEANETNKISLKELPAGTYLIKLYNDKGSYIYTDKVIKE